MECIEKNAAAGATARQDIPAEGVTHIMVNRLGVMTDASGVGHGYKASDLYRVDGLLIASRQDDIVRYGDDISTARNHLFLNDDCALIFLRRLADVDLVCQRDCVFLHERIYIYANEDKCPRAAIIEPRDGDMLEVAGPKDSKVILATPGNRHSLKM